MPGPFSNHTPLPIVPHSILREHDVLERRDTRFRACARLLQSLVRQRLGLSPGRLTTLRGGKRTLGSRLTPCDAGAGANFLSGDIARLARLALVYREPGALIDEQRLLTNMLSSQPLAFNIFGPLVQDAALATRVAQALLPETPIQSVTGIAFEHSPGRNMPHLTGDKTAFDIAIAYERRSGERGFIGIELKYSEGMSDISPVQPAIFDDLAEASGIYKAPASALLRFTGLRQLCREHSLAQAAVMNGDWDEAHFLLIAPQHNAAVVRAANLYRANLAPPLPGHVAFQFVSLERLIDCIDRAGASGHASALHERYTAWHLIDELVMNTIDVPLGTNRSTDLRPFAKQLGQGHIECSSKLEQR